MASELVEREDKYEVSGDFVVPELTDLQADAAVETTRQLLEATYFDTARGHLRRAGITVRKHRGGADDGWQVKLPLGRDRTEIHVDSRATTVPREVSALLLGMRGAERLVATMRISTNRENHSILDADRRLLAVLSDDRVTASAPAEPEVVQEWREVVVELGPGGDDEIRAVLGQRLRDAHASPAVAPSKFVRAMGPLPAPVRRKRLGGLVDAYVQTQLAVVADGDLGLRRDLDVVHPTRVAVRRLRSTLRVFGDVFDAPIAESLELELAWFAGFLGQVRDCDVLGRRLQADVAALPTELVLGPVAAQIESAVGTARASAQQALRAAMNGKRYAALVALLEHWRLDPPYSPAASRRRKTANDHLAAAEKQLRGRLRTAAKPGASADQLHRARKAGKRLRYSAELAAPTLGERASSTITMAQAWQSRLGEFQDSVMAATLLNRLGADAGGAAGENGFTYGLLLAQEWQRADGIRASVRHSLGEPGSGQR